MSVEDPESAVQWFPLVFVFLSCQSTHIVPVLAKLVQRLWFGVSEQKGRMRELQLELDDQTDQLAVMSPISEFANYARKQRSVEAIKQQLKDERSTAAVKSMGTTLAIHAALYLPFVLLCLYILCYSHLFVPVVRIPSHWFYPINNLMSFPGLTVSNQFTEISIQFLSPAIWYFTQICLPAVTRQ